MIAFASYSRNKDGTSDRYERGEPSRPRGDGDNPPPLRVLSDSSLLGLLC